MRTSKTYASVRAIKWPQLGLGRHREPRESSRVSTSFRAGIRVFGRWIRGYARFLTGMVYAEHGVMMSMQPYRWVAPVALVILVTASASAQTWHRAYGGVPNLNPFAAVRTVDGSVTMAGYVGDMPYWNSTLMIRAGADGAIRWSTWLNTDYASDLQLVPVADGGALVVGHGFTADGTSPLLAR